MIVQVILDKTEDLLIACGMGVKTLSFIAPQHRPEVLKTLTVEWSIPAPDNVFAACFCCALYPRPAGLAVFNQMVM